VELERVNVDQNPTPITIAPHSLLYSTKWWQKNDEVYCSSGYATDTVFLNHGTFRYFLGLFLFSRFDQNRCVKCDRRSNLFRYNIKPVQVKGLIFVTSLVHGDGKGENDIANVVMWTENVWSLFCRGASNYVGSLFWVSVFYFRVSGTMIDTKMNKGSTNYLI